MYLNIYIHMLTLFESVSAVFIMFHFLNITESEKSMYEG